MGGAPVIVTIRPGVQFTPDAAASFRRAEGSWRAKTGREQIDCNSTYRDYGLQLSMYQAWTAWTEGRGPKPNHSRAIHPDFSIHCRGTALDSDDWVIPGFIAHMEEHGWIRTAASDPTERHHFEYQWWRDKHYGETVEPATDHALLRRQKEDVMYVKSNQADDVYCVYTDPNGRVGMRLTGYQEAQFALQGGLVIAANPAAITTLGVETGYATPKRTIAQQVWLDTTVGRKAGAGEVRISTIQELADAKTTALELAGRPVAGQVTVDVDESKIAAELAPMVIAALDTWSDADVDRFAKAAADEQDRRARERLDAGTAG